MGSPEEALSCWPLMTDRQRAHGLLVPDLYPHPTPLRNYWITNGTAARKVSGTRRHASPVHRACPVLRCGLAQEQR